MYSENRMNEPSPDLYVTYQLNVSYKNQTLIADCQDIVLYFLMSTTYMHCSKTHVFILSKCDIS